MAEVRKLSGRKVNWKSPPKPNAKCSLFIGGRKRIGGFRNLCHINRTDRLCRKKYGVGLTIFQGSFNNTVAASAGTHDLDAAWDVWINGVGAWEQQKFLRSLGWACWYRHAPAFSNHQHMLSLPPSRGKNVADDFRQAGIKVGIYVDGGFSQHGKLRTSSQLVDYYAGAFGLSGQHAKGADKSWFPKNIKATIFDLESYVSRRAK